MVLLSGKLPGQRFESAGDAASFLTRVAWLQRAAVDGSCLREAPAKILSDSEVALTALGQNRDAYRHLGEDLKSDPDFLSALCRLWLPAIKRNGLELEGAPPAVKDCREAALAAISQYGGYLQYVSDRLREDREVVLAAVSDDGDALAHAGEVLQADRGIVFAAVRKTPSALQFAAPALRDDGELLSFVGILGHSKGVRPEMAIVSVRFEGASSSVTEYSKAVLRGIDAHPFLKDFDVYVPNPSSGCFCGSKDVLFSSAWACRGTAATCGLVKTDGYGRPAADTCWRHALRWHQQRAKFSNGFVVQIIEGVQKSPNGGYTEHALGESQDLREEMTRAVQLKVFRLWQKTDFGAPEVHALAAAVKSWQDEQADITFDQLLEACDVR